MMLVEAIKASLLQEEGQTPALPNGGRHSTAAAADAAPGHAAPTAQALMRKPLLEQAGGKAPGAASSPGLGASPGANPSASRKSSGGLRGLFSLRGRARRGAAQGEARALVPRARQAESAGAASGAAPAPGPAAPGLAAQLLPAEQNAAREMHAPGERDALAAEGPGANPDFAAGAPPQAGKPQLAAQELEQGGSPPAAPEPVPGSGPGLDLDDVRVRAAAVRAARAWQPPGGVAELEAALPTAHSLIDGLPAGSEQRPSDGHGSAAEPGAGSQPLWSDGRGGALRRDTGCDAPPRARGHSEPLPGSECGGAAAASTAIDAGCGAGGKGGHSVPILAAAGGGGDVAGAPHVDDGPVKPPPQTPRGAMDYSALASGRWDEF